MPNKLALLESALADRNRIERELGRGIAAGLQHPHILPVFDCREAAGQLWYTMPFLGLWRDCDAGLRPVLEGTKSELAQLLAEPR